jgi:hypothetical protein
MIKSLIKYPKNIKFESEERGETVYYILRRHPITNLGWILLSIFMILLPLVIMAFLSPEETKVIKYIPISYQMMMIAVWYAITMFVTFENFLLWYFSVYIITDKRVIDVDFTGLWHKRISEASLGSVEDATYSTHNFLNVLLDYGDILMQTAAEKTEFEFYGIPKPGEVHDILTNLVQQFKQKSNG